MKHLLTVTSLLMCASFFTQANEPAGKTILARGSVQAVNTASDTQRQLKRRDTVFDIDSITTGSKSKAQFSMADGGLIALKENSQLNIANYQFDNQTQQGSASIELIKGGLRSISGAIKKNGGEYKINTPVGSIGIRGTHFEIQLVGGEMFLAVWDGAIDLTLDNQRSLSLGSNEDFSFAKITASGEIETSTEAADVFDQQVTPIDDTVTDDSENQQTAATNSDTTETAESTDDSEIVSIYTEQQYQSVTNASLIEQIAQREGVFNYQATNFAVASSVGEVTDFSMSMAVDFDDGTVPNGEISFTDAQGSWYAAYSGLINVSELDLAVTFASHANNNATGDIDAIFLNGLDSITGNFNLNEIENPDVNATGSFQLEP
jgi:hypothetical protein